MTDPVAEPDVIDPTPGRYVVVDVTGDGVAILRRPDDLAGEQLTACPADQLGAAAPVAPGMEVTMAQPKSKTGGKVTGPATKTDTAPGGDTKGETDTAAAAADAAEQAAAAVDAAGIGVDGFAAALAAELGKGVTAAQLEAAIKRVLAAADPAGSD